MTRGAVAGGRDHGSVGSHTDLVFRAVSDPTRRAILELLKDDERSASDLARPFEMTQAAISQHLRTLRDADLVRVRKEGRQRIYRLNPLPLHVLYDWAAYFEDFWRQGLGALGRYLDESPDAPPLPPDSGNP